jgi:predicted PhzF superfamily epimerase YddE/YHI9
MNNKVVQLPLYQADAFTSVPFAGNPAGVVLLAASAASLPDATRQAAAAEVNVAETAFVEASGGNGDGDGGLAVFSTSDTFKLRWFTPAAEVPLCGHATLAAAHVLFEELGNSSAALHFDTVKSGRLTVTRAAPGGSGGGSGSSGRLLELSLPLVAPSAAPPPGTDVAALVAAATRGCIAAVEGAAVSFAPGVDYFLIVLPAASLAAASGGARAAIESILPDIPGLLASTARGAARGVIVAAAAGNAADEGYDFYSRFFGPWVQIDEDPVTGSAHSVLAAHFTQALGKRAFRARQCSPRGGDVAVRIEGGRVVVSGAAVTTIRGAIVVPEWPR